ncbi:hypothetical protein [Hymenobacter rubripertinctus]|uniref:DUF3298 domain-containing protein n=1 Tax=Hymenobacter rubripertinctus TaxID=2029981 RepID=A0A418RA38_9BACT|nr:hypothetical protein [Hymenobacter rubripertinctus]RIY14145.1 hypothetical protein D0T11_00195 [Hymenobacter rubripertinctus]
MHQKKMTKIGLFVLLLSGGSAARAQDTWTDLRAEQVAKLRAMTGAYEGQLAGKYPVRLLLSPGPADTLVTGMYYYLSKGQPLNLTGFTRPSVPTQRLELRETVPTAADATGWFTLGLSFQQELLGSWYNASGTTLLPVSLRRVGGAARPAALVAHITPKTYLNSFRVPVITMPDASVTRLLAHWFSLRNLTGDDVPDLRGLLAEHSGIQAADYTTNYNARGLLSLTVLTEGLGASVWYDAKTHNLDLITGFPILLADELKPELLPQFLALGQEKLAERNNDCVANQAGFLSDEDKVGVLGQEFSLSSTQEYTMGPTGLVLDHPVSYDGLSNFVFKVLQGSFPITFTYAELKPFLRSNSPLRRLL